MSSRHRNSGPDVSLFLLATFSSVFAILPLRKPSWASAVNASFILVGPFAPNVFPCFRWHTVIIYSYIVFLSCLVFFFLLIQTYW